MVNGKYRETKDLAFCGTDSETLGLQRTSLGFNISDFTNELSETSFLK